MNSVTVRVPGTTANLGSGFDTLGLAVALHNRARLTRRRSPGATVASPIPEAARDGATAMFDAAAAAFFRAARVRAFGFDIHLDGDVPMARGLGSSVTARLGCVAGLNALTGDRLDRTALLGIVSALEGHPDNAAPAVFGGFTAAGFVGREVRCVRVPLRRDLRFVTLVPPFEVSTPAARTLVPLTFSKADTVHSLNRSALVAAAFASGDYAALRGCFDDRVHQPWRSVLIPQLDSVIQAGVKAGAVGGWLSGSGSTIMCLALAESDTAAISKAMLRKLPGSAVHVLKPDNEGVKVMTER
jgi:homoserine kinase